MFISYNYSHTRRIIRCLNVTYVANKYLSILNVYKIIDCNTDQCYVSCRICWYSTYYSRIFILIKTEK